MVEFPGHTHNVVQMAGGPTCTICHSIVITPIYESDDPRLHRIADNVALSWPDILPLPFVLVDGYERNLCPPAEYIEIVCAHHNLRTVGEFDKLFLNLAK